MNKEYYIIENDVCILSNDIKINEIEKYFNIKITGYLFKSIKNFNYWVHNGNNWINFNNNILKIGDNDE